MTRQITLDRRRLGTMLGGALVAPLVIPLATPRRIGAQERDSWPTEGWPGAAPEDLGIDPAVFDEATARLRTEAPRLTGLVVTVGNAIVYEYAAEGTEPDTATDIWSSTKSVTSALTGIAIDDGLFTLDSTLGELIPDRIPAGADPGTSDVTVRDLLTMSGGWEWDGTVDYANLDNTDDWAGRTLSLPIVAEPGETFIYNSGNAHLFSVIIQELTGQTLRQFAEERLLGPIGVAVQDWAESPQGETAGGWGLTITPRDMAKIGFLALNNGSWEGEQLVPEDWLEESTQIQIEPSEDNDFGNGTGYGYFWWVAEVEGYEAYFSLGYGESYIYVVPELDLVIAAACAQVPALDAPDLQARPEPVFRETLIPGIAARDA